MNQAMRGVQASHPENENNGRETDISARQRGRTIMADSSARYDFTQNRLSLRMRLIGLLLLLAGVVYVFLAYLMYRLDAGYSTGPDTAAMTGDILIMVIGAVLVVLSVLTLIAPSKPSLAQAASIVALALAVLCAVAFGVLLAIGDSSGFGRVCAIIGIPVAFGVRSLINQGKVA
jgi:hypothetical protein